ncbi:Protein of unknown function, partial [Gryllus bimaculatus]
LKESSFKSYGDQISIDSDDDQILSPNKLLQDPKVEYNQHFEEHEAFPARNDMADIREDGASPAPEEPQAARARLHECAPKTRRLRSPPALDGMDDGDADSEGGSDSDSDGDEQGEAGEGGEATGAVLSGGGGGAAAPVAAPSAGQDSPRAACTSANCCRIRCSGANGSCCRSRCSGVSGSCCRSRCSGANGSCCRSRCSGANGSCCRSRVQRHASSSGSLLADSRVLPVPTPNCCRCRCSAPGNQHGLAPARAATPAGSSGASSSSSSSSSRSGRAGSDSPEWRPVVRVCRPHCREERLSPCCLHERLALVQAMEALPPLPLTPPHLLRASPPPDPPLNLPVPRFSPSPCPSPLSLPPPSPSSSCSPSSLSPPPLSPCPSPVSLPPPPQSPTGSGSPWDESDFTDDDLDLISERHVDGGD